VKQVLRNVLGLGAFGLGCLGVSAGCSDTPAGPPIGSAFGGNATTTGGASAGSFSSSGMTTTTGGNTTSTAGTFSTSGTFSMAGTVSTAGTDTGGGGGGGSGAGTGGAAGTTTGGTSAGMAGTGGTPVVGDFPAGCPAPVGAHTGTAFARTCFSITASSCAATTANMDPPAKALDGDEMTRWSTGAVMDSSIKFTFTVDLGSAVMVSGVTATTKNGPNAMPDGPPQIEVSTSPDGNAFTPVACGDTGASIDVGFAATNARYVRLVQHGVAAGNWWAIHELNVYGTGTTCATGTSTHMCTLSVMQ
jgi:hypothetical protein